MVIIEWITSNIGAIIICIVVVLAAIISWRIYLRKRMLQTPNSPQNIQNPSAIDKPNVVVFLRPHATCVQCLMLCIENVGTETAYNIQFGTGSIPFLNSVSSNVSNVHFLKKNELLKKGLSCFGPGQKLEQFLIILNERLPEELKQPLQISVTYVDSKYNTIENRYSLDFTEFEGILQINSIEEKATSESSSLLQILQTGFSQVIESVEGLRGSHTSKANDGEPLQKVEEISQFIKGVEEKPLTPNLQKLVSLYNQGNHTEIQNIFDSTCSIRVTNETELYHNPNITPIFETKANGSFVTYYIDSENLYAVVPFPGCILQNDLYSSGAFGRVFECPGFDPKYKYDIKVIRPAFFKHDNEIWTLEQKGKLELTEKDQ